MLRVLDKMDTFEGRSQFTTWVHKIAVRIALTELRRLRWKDVSLDNMIDSEESYLPPHLMADSTPGPESSTEQSDLLAHVQRLISEELTDKQRQAMIGYVNEEIRKHRQDEDRAGVIVFGRDAAIEIPPFDDDLIIAGQGTIGKEIIDHEFGSEIDAITRQNAARLFGLA